MPCPGVLWVHPPSGAGGQGNHRAQGRDAPPPTRARSPRLLPHTHLLCVSDSHTAGASCSGCSHDHPPAPRHAQPFLCPRPASHTLSALPSRPWHKRRCVLPAPSQAPSPSRSFIHSTKRSLNTHQIPGCIPGAEDPIDRRKKRNRQTSLLSWHLPSDREITNRIDN